MQALNHIKRKFFHMTDYAVVHGDTLMVYSGGEIVARIDVNRFPGLIVELATALRWRSEKRDDPAVPLG